MTLDPYRTLGLEPGATTAEVKRAYRRLAKTFHPDSAGEAALPRFLAIHEAYDAIKTGRPMGGTRAGAQPAETPTASPGPEPWRADPARARAARERARTARGRRTGGASTRPGSSATADPPGGQGRGSGPGRSSGGRSSAGTGQRTSGTAGTGSSGSRGRRGGTRKATMGSTSYDEARDHADATWSGASWYGPTSGEYWIINPREYADPRKHGPEYQSRARRMAADASVSGTLEDEPPFVSMPTDDDGASPGQDGSRWAGAGSADGGPAGRHQAFETRSAAADPSRRRTRAERLGRAAHAAHAAQGAHARRPVRPVPSSASPSAAWDTARIRAARMGVGLDASPVRRPSIGESARDWLGGSDDPVRRIGSALVAWPPIGLAAAATIGEVTGCSVYSSACGGTDSLLPWLAQAGILGLLLLVPAFARLLAGGTVAVLLALVPVTAFLLVVGGAGEPEAGFALAFLLGIAWLLGVAGAIVASRRRGEPDRAGDWA